MLAARTLAVLVLMSAASGAALAADDIIDAIEQGRKAYQSGDLAGAKQSLDLASQLIGQKNAEGFAALLPAPLAGWKAGKAETTAVGNVAFGASSASRTYTGPNDADVTVQITGDSALLAQFAMFINNPQIAGAMGKIIRIGNQRAIQGSDGDIHLVIANKFLIQVTGSASADIKAAYAGGVDVAKLSKM